VSWGKCRDSYPLPLPRRTAVPQHRRHQVRTLASWVVIRGVFGFCVKVDIELGNAAFIVAAVFQVNGRLGANVGSLKSLKRWIVKTVRMANTLAR